ncbi:hypothetical protein Q8F55_006099 [Vanrija albida]|uniref:Magnesium-transporting ATPase, P-type 1 n=1 Tax=Vanrija albida TaxID=181172 RepID=A0ABR3Q3N9_9TREE
MSSTARPATTPSEEAKSVTFERAAATPNPATYGTFSRLRRALRRKDTRSLADSVEAAISARLGGLATQPPAAVLFALESDWAGLSATAVDAKLKTFGPNALKPDNKLKIPHLIFSALVNPFSVILVCLAIIAIATGDNATFTVIMVMVVVSAALRFWQDLKSVVKAKRLAQGVKTMVHVRRTNFGLTSEAVVDSAELVPGDILELRSGDLIPADCILLEAASMSVSQSMLTGEALPIDKSPYAEDDVDAKDTDATGDMWAANVLLSGTSVAFGQGVAVVVTTGPRTYFASMGDALAGPRKSNAFERTVRRVSYLLLAVTILMAPIVLVIQGTVNKSSGWKNALLFALSVAVGLTPEMLPVVVNANLARGAILLARKNVLVKRLDGVQNLGGITTFCTDKTGTLTIDNVEVHSTITLQNKASIRPLHLAVVNSTLQTGARSLLDHAVVNANDGTHGPEMDMDDLFVDKVHEIPFDSARRMLSVVVRDKRAQHTVITKGAVDEVLSRCKSFTTSDTGSLFETTSAQPLSTAHRAIAKATALELNEQGLRLVAVAIRSLGQMGGFADEDAHSDWVEQDLTLVGFVAFLDPPKEDAKQAIVDLRALGIRIKILTGDAPEIARKVACQVGLLTDAEAAQPETVLTGEGLAVLVGELTAEEVTTAIKNATVLAKLSPFQKRQVVELLQASGEAVGMMGDGVNDALALQAADVGISVDTGTEVAKSASEIILLEKSLDSVVDGVLLGRKSMLNTIKYFKMTLSSNFGNVFSIMAASFWLPYQPMQPIQLLIQNILYDLSQAAIPFDNVDEDMLAVPVQWSLLSILRFMLVFGPTSSFFDIATFSFNWFYYGYRGDSDAGVAVAQTHWFLEGSMTQTLVVFILRTDKLPFVQSRPSAIFAAVVVTMLTVAQVLPWIPGLNTAFQFVHPKGLIYPFLVGVAVTYCALVQVMKVVYKRFFHEWF